MFKKEVSSQSAHIVPFLDKKKRQRLKCKSIGLTCEDP